MVIIALFFVKSTFQTFYLIINDVILD